MGLLAELETIAMSNWLSRAKEALSGREAQVVSEPIEIACPCGRSIEAIRRPTFQRVLCKRCGEAFFLLPADVYPRPVMKVRKVKPTKPVEQTASKSSGKSAPVSATAPETAVAPAKARIDVSAQGRAAVDKVRTQFTPLRLIALSLLTVVVVTGWWQWNRSARAAAEINFKAANEAGLSAMKKQEFVEAAQQFGRAAAAADVLRRTDAPAEQARQRVRQLTALNALLNRSLFEVIESARATRLRENALAAQSEFANLHAGRWVVLQSDIVPHSEAGGSAVAVWEQQILIFDEPLILTGNLPVFSKIPAASAVAGALPNADAVPAEAQSPIATALNDLGQREVFFAAQVESLKWSDEKSAWVLTLKSSSAFLWSDYDLLQAAGLPPDELHTEAQLRAMLAEQSRWVGAAE